MCARTAFLKTEVTLWRRGAEVWRLEVARSLANYVAGVLEEAGRAG